MVSNINNIVWIIFLPIIITMSITIIVLMIKKMKITHSMKSEKSSFKKSIGPLAISLGAMIGTGAIIGVLGSILNLYNNGQFYFEAICGWAIIGMIILLPIVYLETFIAKEEKKIPSEYILIYLGKNMMKVYIGAFVLLHVLGFSGFQILGINSTITIFTDNLFHIELSQLQRYIFIILPLLIFISAIVISKKENLFINTLAIFIFIAIILYVIFSIIFVIKTSDYMSVFVSNIVEGMQNPITSIIGIPLGMLLSFQRIVQSAEPGLGAFPLSAMQNDGPTLTASKNAFLGAFITIIISVYITTYITSYGVYNNIITLDGANSYSILEGFFLTGFNVEGYFGIFTIGIFALLSGITTLLGSSYFLNKLFDFKENTNIIIYLIMIFIAGTFAIFGVTFIFDLVDFLLFIVLGINLLALLIYAIKK